METPQKQPKFKKGLSVVFWGILIILVAIIVSSVLTDRGEQPLVVRNSSGFQAVFLDNNQVYFGQLRDLGGDFASLSDIYYLRAGSVQQGATGAAEGGQIDLVKLGAELHAPADEMIISKDHIVFYEDIREEGEIMKLIREHKAQ